MTTMARLPAVMLGLLLLSACKLAPPARFTDTGATIAIDCGGPVSSWDACNAEANAACGPAGYTETFRLGDTVERITAGTPRAPLFGQMRRTLVVQCAAN